MTSEQEQLKVRQQVDICYQQVEAVLKQAFSRPSVSFSLRGKAAGTANLATNQLRFNPILLHENLNAFLTEVVPHEICHLIAHQQYGRVRPHGKEWQALMINIFALRPTATHQFNTQSVTGKQFDYQCGCGLVKLSIRRHNKVMRGETQYRCRRCQQTLRRFA